MILYPFVLAVRQDHPLKSMADLIAYAKANPGKLSFSSTGVGTTQHLTGVLLQTKAGIEMNHISYRGATQAVQDVLGGRVDVLIETLTQTSPLISSGQMRGLARHDSEGLADTARHPADRRHCAGLRGQRLDGRGDHPWHAASRSSIA